MNRQDEIKNKLKVLVLERIDFSREMPDEEIKDVIDELIIGESKRRPIGLEERKHLRKELFYSIRKLDILQELVDDASITEIMINGPDEIFIERRGSVCRCEMKFESTGKLEDVIQQMVAGCNRTVNEASPIVDARLENGSRVNVVLSPVALNGPIVTIRKFPDNPIMMKDLLAFGTLTEEAAGFLSKLVQAKYNIFISGGTGSGKTTFLNALSYYIPQEERIITIEDNAELQIKNIPNIVKMETRNSNVEGCKEITIRDLIKTSLRMRPSRIIVGEVRGGEAIDMMQCLNTGHDGSMSTGHANSCADMLSRLETMVLMGMDLPICAIRQQMASGIDIIVHLGRLRDKSRRVLEIVEIIGYEDDKIRLSVLYSFEEEGEDKDGRVIGMLKRKEELTHVGKLKAAGISRE
ncbi:pilus assembly protein CpaF [Kineothrix alysoides]|uniref:Pilus assembly protein CpaF n=1 Tax=Kineothrix alysoides TaxID=1469948 RepID=A0A4R1QM23_9FIRM|nr:CpaF family protein [Kineothrix alysoides]TCL54277.1 pilus assembly protein CpaF [Kineothrix alysoides]